MLFRSSELSILDFRERLKVGGETEGYAILRQNEECSEMGEGHVSHVGYGYVRYMKTAFWFMYTALPMAVQANHQLRFCLVL